MQSASQTVLVVEDDPAVRGLLREVLEEEGYAVQSAPDVAAGLAGIQAGDVDLVLLDLRLPGTDGLELCRRVRGTETASHLPIVVLTAALEEEVPQAASLAAGADSYLAKPFDIDDLLDHVRTYLDRRDEWPA